MSHSKFMKDVILIGFTQVLTSLGGFLLLPVITKYLGTYYYGVWAQINVTISLLTPLALMGLSMAFVRFLSSAEDKETIKEGVYSILIFVFFSSLFFSLLLYIGATPLATFAFHDPNIAYFIKFASVLIIFNSIDIIILFYFRIYRQIIAFSYFSIFQSIGKLIFAGLLLWMGYGLIGVIVAFIIVQITIFIIAVYKIVYDIGFVFPKFNQIREYLHFSLPLTPNSMIRWVTDSSDKYLVTYFLGLGSVGIYSAAYSIGWLINLLIAPIQFILYPELSKLFDEGKEDQVKMYLSYSLRYFLMLAIPAVFGLTALAKPLLSFLTTADFISGYFIIPIIAFSGLIAGILQIMFNITHLVKKTKYNLWFQMIGAILNIVLNIFLIPSMGIIAAAISTLVSYISILLLCTWISFKYIKFEIGTIFIIKSTTSSIIMFLILMNFQINNPFDLIAAIVSGIISYLVMLIFLRTFNKQEVNLLKKTIMWSK